MLFRWIRNRRRRKVSAKPFPQSWSDVLDTIPLVVGLSDSERAKLQDTTRIIVLEKNWEACGGIDLTQEMKLTIAAQASLLILHLEHDYYRRAKSILVYPSAIVVEQQKAGPGYSSQVSDMPVAGLAQLRGPVVLAWDSVKNGTQNSKDGQNVVLHEFAHKLDMLDNYADGAPPLASSEQSSEWARVMSEHFAELTEKAESGRRSVLDKYGATNPAEFFAVSTESFFEEPKTMKRKLPELYDLLVDYYKQDPAARLES